MSNLKDFVSELEKRTKIKFDPLPTISHEELIDILKQKWARIDISQRAWGEMKPDMKRHFKELL